MSRHRPLLSMFIAAIVLILAGLLPSAADAHAGHGAAPRISASPPSFASADERDGATREGAILDVVAVADTADGGPAPAGTCPTPCCCAAGDAGCSAPALGLATVQAVPPVPRRGAPAAGRPESPPDPLDERLPKPPRA